ncbi:MAG: InlB B-repeat-containing protein [Anaeroplasmataceae bacterium]|nr:InlB B-repeat-containing protein [Anaeroplasmataceae bacterium]
MKKILIVLILFTILFFVGCHEESKDLKYYTVEFNSDGGTFIPSQKIEEGKKATKPTDPSKEGCVFSGWYLKEEEFNFTTSITSNLILKAHWQTEYDDYGMPVIEITLADISISQSGFYTSMEEVGAYIYTFHELPNNYRTKQYFNKNEYTSENKLSVGGDQFYNREQLLPYKNGRTYTECDIDYKGTSRGSKRIVYSSDWLIFYTSNHYSSFSILRFV